MSEYTIVGSDEYVTTIDFHCGTVLILLVAVATVTQSNTIGFTVHQVVFTWTGLPVVFVRVNGLVHTVIGTFNAFFHSNSSFVSLHLPIMQG